MSSTTRRLPGRPREAGQILVLFAGGLVTLLIVAALAFDVGMMLVERRDQQNAADAAALAGARYVMTDAGDPCAATEDCPKAEAAARRIARENGFDDADPDEVVNVFIKPHHGRYVGFAGFIEVQIEATRPSIFGGIIGKAAWPVGAFAVATNKQDLSFPFSMIALDPTACKAIAVEGTGAVNAVGTIQSNSSGIDCGGTDPAGWISFSRTGGSTINVGEDVYCRAFGAIQDQGSGDIDCTIDPNKFMLPDPLLGLAEPGMPELAPAMQFVGPGTAPATLPKNCPGSTTAPPSTTSPAICKLAQTGAYAGLSWILHPGLYPGGLEITADTTAYLMPGLYWIGGGGIRVATGGSIMTIDEVTDAKPSAADVAWEPTRDHLTPPAGLGGVLIYNSDVPPAGGPIVFDGSAATMKLMPLDVPESDPRSIYNNIVIFQDRSLAASVTLNGSASESVVGGLIYAPAAQIKLLGNGGTLTVGQIIVGTYDIKGGGGTINITDDDLFEAIIRAAGLVD